MTKTKLMITDQRGQEYTTIQVSTLEPENVLIAVVNQGGQRLGHITLEDLRHLISYTWAQTYPNEPKWKQMRWA